ncbi:MAG: hypothetical protein QJR10_05090 [Bacillota bacterium]|nr:hypothetical protein [Bacillota bacterium]
MKKTESEPRNHEEHSAGKRSAPTSVQSHAPVEPEDAQLTGASRSLQRRLLGLNVENGHAQQHPDTPAGQHATESFTGEKKK